jgi:hypothetical protein
VETGAVSEIWVLLNVKLEMSKDNDKNVSTETVQNFNCTTNTVFDRSSSTFLATAALTTTTRPEVPRRLKKEEEAKRKSREDPEWPA